MNVTKQQIYEINIRKFEAVKQLNRQQWAMFIIWVISGAYVTHQIFTHTPQPLLTMMGMFFLIASVIKACETNINKVLLLAEQNLIGLDVRTSHILQKPLVLEPQGLQK